MAPDPQQPSPPPTPPHEPLAGTGGLFNAWRRKTYAVIFESDTRAGRAFDITVIWLIVASLIVVILDSVASFHERWKAELDVLEWTFTLLFTAEYVARLWCVRRPMRYATSVFGIVDLLAVLPTYLAILVPGLHALIDVRVLRLLRVFRILKLGAYVAEFGMLGQALLATRRKILAFLSFVLVIVLVMGTLMYVVEGPQNGYTSIPVGVYWAITTMTTVGFGDITPKTDLGRFIASVMMLLGWGTLAVPTGIVSAEFTAQRGEKAPRATPTPTPTPTPRTCPQCLTDGHGATARYCAHCGTPLPAVPHDA